MVQDPRARAAKAAAQQLAGLRAAGVTRVPRPAAATVAKATVVSLETAAVPRSTGDTDRNVCATGNKEGVQVAVNAAVSVPCSARSNVPFGAPRSTASRAEREQQLREVAGRVVQCTRCAELASTRTQTVFGVGNPEARLVFVGEAPGADEDRVGEPFVGAAGQLLNRILEASKLKREDVYICNILRCRPPGNRNPEPEEAANCREYLDAQLATIDPDYIVCLGSIAAKNLLGITESIGKLRGRFLQQGRAKVLCTYHPAYLLRNPSAKKEVWDDMKILLRDMGVELETR